MLSVKIPWFVPFFNTLKQWVFLNKGRPHTCYFMRPGKHRQHSFLTAIDQITSKPQRIMFLQREPLVPRWAPVKEVAKSQLTLLPNCKEPGCITLLATLSIPEEVFLSGVQERPPPRAAGSGLQLGEAHAATRGWGGGREKTQPGRLEPCRFQPPTLLLQDVSVLVPPPPCLFAHHRPHGLGKSWPVCCLQRCPHGYTVWVALACLGCRTFSSCFPVRPCLRAFGLV